VKKTPDKPPKIDRSDDATLFRATVGRVSPLPTQNRITLTSARRYSAVRDQAENLVSVPDVLSDFMPDDVPNEYLGNGVSRMTLRKLRRGHWPIADSIDLHGYHIDEARKILQVLLHETYQKKQRCVLIIHGKGINSQGGKAVLRQLTRHWLTQLPIVSAYCDASASQGGSGAVLVLLKSNA
jgi:DNA-nicking Smr family endonuclease